MPKDEETKEDKVWQVSIKLLYNINSINTKTEEK